MKYRMKHPTIGLMVILLMVFLSACKKDTDQNEIDHGLIEEYVLENNITGAFTPSGLYYHIEDPGGDIHPTLESNVTVTYNGYTLTGSAVDHGSFVNFELDRLIAGWQEGIPLIGESGEIKLIIPSELAYNKGVLVFDITLHYFSK